MPLTRPARMTLHVISTTTTLNVGVVMDFLAAIVEIVSHEGNLCQWLDYNPCVHLLNIFIIVDIVLISKTRDYVKENQIESILLQNPIWS